MHLYIVLTDPDSAGNQVIANITTREQWKDQSCVLDAGDHPFIRRESVVNYAEASVASEAKISEAVRRRLFEPDLPVSQEVLDKVQAGALVSSQIEPKAKNAVKAALGQ